MRRGTIIKGVGGLYSVYCDGAVYECSARGVLRRRDTKPMVGDKVSFDEEKRVLEEIHTRRNSLIRPSVANIDTIVIVCATQNPRPDLQLIDKLSVASAAVNIEVAICINKSDIADCDEVESLAAIYKSVPYPVFVTSAKNDEGIDALLEFLKGKLTAFAGLSGVGKSSILGIITGDSLETGETSRIERGRHTTRHVELMEAKNGALVLDTPGFSQLEIDNLRAKDLWQYFPEITRIEGKCRFSDCAHIGEDGCALQEGEAIVPSRRESYIEFYNTLKTIKEWER